MSLLAIAAARPGRGGRFAGLGDTKPCVPRRAAHYRFFGHRCRAYGRLRRREGSLSRPHFGLFVRSQVNRERLTGGFFAPYCEKTPLDMQAVLAANPKPQFARYIDSPPVCRSMGTVLRQAELHSTHIGQTALPGHFSEPQREKDHRSRLYHVAVLAHDGRVLPG